MKYLILSCLIIIVFIGFGFQTKPEARVIRLMLNENTNTWRMSVNNTGTGSNVNNDTLTNKLAQLHLQQGDIILLGSIFNKEPGPMTETWKWLGNYTSSNKVAVYLYGVISNSLAKELFAIPVYHWSAPFSDPRDLSAASFFYEGKYLGSDNDGYQAMLNMLSRNRDRKVFILGSMYDRDSSLPHMPTPYEDQHDKLDNVLKAVGTIPIEMDPFYPF